MCLSMSLSALVALALLFFPKIYVIVCKPEKNIRSHFTTSKDVRCHIGGPNSRCVMFLGLFRALFSVSHKCCKLRSCYTYLCMPLEATETSAQRDIRALCLHDFVDTVLMLDSPRKVILSREWVCSVQPLTFVPLAFRALVSRSVWSYFLFSPAPRMRRTLPAPPLLPCLASAGPPTLRGSRRRTSGNSSRRRQERGSWRARPLTENRKRRRRQRTAMSGE